MFGRAGYQVDSFPKMLILQFIEDLSDRELARFLAENNIAENNGAKLFCNFSLTDKTPDHSFQITASRSQPAWHIKAWKIKALQIKKKHRKLIIYSFNLQFCSQAIKTKD